MSKEILAARLDKITQAAESFCTQKLDNDYLLLSQKLIGKLGRKKPSPLLKGKEEIWAAGVIHALGQVNYLYDREAELYITFDDLIDFFDAKKSTVGNKAADIRKMFKMDRMDNFEFMTEKRKKDDFIYNSVLVDGLIVSIDSIPEEYRRMAIEAREKGKQISFKTK